eukprot:6705261-Alexandrium_andersonii.AAC.1
MAFRSTWPASIGAWPVTSATLPTIPATLVTLWVSLAWLLASHWASCSNFARASARLGASFALT